MDGNSTIDPSSDSTSAASPATCADPASLRSQMPAKALDTGSREQGAEHTEDMPETAVEGAGSPRRHLKLVLTLTPAETTGYRALLALGADDCDPMLRSVEVVDLPAALDEIVSLVAAAEARWKMQPRNQKSIEKTTTGTSARRASSQQRPTEGQVQASGAESPDTEAAKSDQLSLFG